MKASYLFHIQALHGIGGGVRCKHCGKKDFKNRSKFDKHVKEFENRWESVRRKMKKREKVLNEEHSLLKNEYVNWIKKMMVEEVSLVRSIQYDIDTMIKASGVFELKPYHKKEFFFVKEFSALESLDLKISDPYERVKEEIFSGRQEIKAKSKVEVEKLNGENVQRILSQLGKEYWQAKEPVLMYIESFRLKNVFKFNEETFEELTAIFSRLFEASYQHTDLATMNKLILYGSSYSCGKKSILNMMKGLTFLSDSHLWKFLMLADVEETVRKCGKLEEKEMHTRNNIYSSLVCSSIRMMELGIEKQEVKNLVVKVGKSFGLEERQVEDLMKFVDRSDKAK